MNIRAYLIYALFAAVLTACGPQNKAAEPSPEPCLPGALVAPVNVDPGTNYEIINDLDHLFVWSYSSCEPEGWRAEVAPHDPETYEAYDPAEIQFGLPLPAQTSWVFAEPLQPASAYEWHVEAYIGGVEGPYSTTTIFWTGPICTSEELAEPTQLSPADESVVIYSVGQPFIWEFTGSCVPEFTNFEIGTNPGFSGENLGNGLGPPRLLSYPIDALENCTDYFWRVRNQSSDSESPWSSVWSFTTDFNGDCSQQAPAPPAGPPMGLATRDLNCRAGDNTAFNEIGFFPQGQIAEIIGTNRDGSWYVVPLRLGGGNCWVSVAYVDLLDGFDPADLTVIASPPLPTPTSTTPPQARPTATYPPAQ